MVLKLQALLRGYTLLHYCYADTNTCVRMHTLVHLLAEVHGNIKKFTGDTLLINDAS